MTTKLNDIFFNQLLLKASESTRKRSHYNIHKDLNESVQRVCIGLKKGTYVQPHHHPQDNKWELILVLRGSICLIIFDKEGSILEKLLLNPGNTLSGVEMKPNTWHTIFPLTEEAVIIETKEGPYIPIQESDFAAWAPAEGDANVMEFLNWLAKAKTSERYSA